MKKVFNTLRLIVAFIAILVFGAAVVLTILGGYEMVLAFTHLQESDEHQIAALIATGLLKAIDMFLMAIVFFVLSLGFMILFTSPETDLPVQLPTWLRVRNFMQLKVILWEAILTTLVVSYLAGLAEKKIEGARVDLSHLVIPGVILLISVSLYFLSKGEKMKDENH
jgi:uncharacterized membrane protein YqhA